MKKALTIFFIIGVALTILWTANGRYHYFTQSFFREIETFGNFQNYIDAIIPTFQNAINNFNSIGANGDFLSAIFDTVKAIFYCIYAPFEILAVTLMWFVNIFVNVTGFVLGF